MTKQQLSRRNALSLMARMAAIVVVAPPDLARREGLPHPDPRPDITGANVLPDDKLPDKKAVREAYAAAREYPELFDGLCCACNCTKSMGHRSLLSCFESEQPTGCWGCREQAELVAKMAKQGKTLAEIRKVCDDKWG